MSVPRPIGPRDLPALRDHLLDQWRPGRAFRAVAETMARRAAPGWPFTHLDPRFDTKQLQAAALWWVDDDATGLVDAARGDYPGDVILGQGVMPVHASGLAVFARPLVGTDAMDATNKVTVDAVLWGPVNLPRLPSEGPGYVTRMGLSMSVYSWWSYDEGLSPEQLQDERALQVMGHEEVQLREQGLGRPTGRTPDGRTIHQIVMHDGFWVPLGRSDWVLGTALDAQLAELAVDPERWASMREDRQLMGALWSLAAQPHVTQAATEPLTGPERRRHVRQHGRQVPAEVHVLRLRPQRVHVDGEAVQHPVAWSCRWPVKPHWRNQAYGPGRTLRRPVLVPAHVKGPAGAPLKRPAATVWHLDGNDPTTEGE